MLPGLGKLIFNQEGGESFPIWTEKELSVCFLGLCVCVCCEQISSTQICGPS